MRIRVIGIGTPHGDDAAGLCVAQRLAGRLPQEVGVVACHTPGPDLAQELEGVDAAVLVDAMCSGGRPGQVRRIDPDALPQVRSWSSHGFGLADGLELARALGREPGWLALVGIEVARTQGEGLSPPVERGVAEACAAIRAIVGELRDGSA